jgi:hypothetical protein
VTCNSTTAPRKLSEFWAVIGKLLSHAVKLNRKAMLNQGTCQQRNVNSAYRSVGLVLIVCSDATFVAGLGNSNIDINPQNGLAMMRSHQTKISNSIHSLYTLTLEKKEKKKENQTHTRYIFHKLSNGYTLQTLQDERKAHEDPCFPVRI